jgi:hypothetical protein
MERRHDVRAVRIEGDLAETLRLALGAVHAARHVEPFQRGVRLGRDLDFGLPEERRVGDGAGEPFTIDRGLDGPAVDPGGDQAEVLAIEPEAAIPARGIRAEDNARQDAGGGRVQAEGQLHTLDEPGGSGVVRKVNGGGACVFHRASLGFGGR